MKSLLALMAVTLGAVGCTGSQGLYPVQPSPVIVRPTLELNRSSLAFSDVGENDYLNPAELFEDFLCMRYRSSDESVVTVASTPNGGKVTAVDFGTATVIADNLGTPGQGLTCGNGTGEVRVPVAVWPNGEWKGSVQWNGACLGSDPAYGETAVISVDRQGAGSVTVKDTPGFDRVYQISIPSTREFESTGAFTYMGVGVGGHLKMALHKTQIAFLETTAWGNCSNTYGGLLSK